MPGHGSRPGFSAGSSAGRHSGNGFSQAHQAGLLASYFVVGLHEGYNSREMLDRLRATGGGLVTYESIFVGYFGGPYYSFNRGAYHIILLDSEVPGESGRIAGRQLQWLKADLASHRQALLTFVAVHEPLFPVDGHRGESLDQHPKERDALHQLFMEEGVDCVFSGHEHLFHRQQIGGVDYVINGGAGGGARRERGAGRPRRGESVRRGPRRRAAVQGCLRRRPRGGAD